MDTCCWIDCSQPEEELVVVCDLPDVRSLKLFHSVEVSGRFPFDPAEHGRTATTLQGRYCMGACWQWSAILS